MRTLYINRRVAMLNLLAAIFLLLSGCSAETEKPLRPLRMGYIDWQGYAPLSLAGGHGFYGDTKVDIVDYASATQVLRALRNGTIDVAGLTLDEVLLLSEDIPDIRVILGLDVSDGGDVILGQPEIKSLADLKGKRIGVEMTALGAYMLSRGLEKVGLKPEQVTIVNTQFDAHERIFAEKGVDAIVTFEPRRTELLNQGATLLMDSSEIPNEIFDVLVVREELITKRSENVQDLVNGWFQALDYINSHPTEAYAEIGGYLGIDDVSKMEEVYALAPLMDKLANERLFTGEDALIFMQSKKLNDLMLANDLLKDPVETKTLIDKRFLGETSVLTPGA